MTYVKINGVEYPATISGLISDSSWDGRESKTIILENTYEAVKELFVDGAQWSIVCKEMGAKIDETGNVVMENGEVVMEEKEEVFDNSEFSMSGAITDNRNGTISVKMGKATELENAYAIILGGNE